MNRPPRRAISPHIIAMGHEFENTKQSSSIIDYNDIGRREHPHVPPPYDHASLDPAQSHHHHHQVYNNNLGMSNNNNISTYDNNEPSSFQSTKHHHNQSNYPLGYIDQHLPSTYRSTLREAPPNASPPSQAMVTSNSPLYKILCITNISPEIGDGVVKEAIFNDFSRFGDILVNVCHDGDERLVYIYFRTYEEAREARHSKLHSMLFDRPIEIEPIYEPRQSPADSPLTPPFRRRSGTPPDFYPENGPLPRRTQGPPVPSIPRAQHHNMMSPPHPAYGHPARYPPGPVPPPHAMTNLPYDRHYADPQYSHHHTQPSSYAPPATDPHRSYPMNPPLNQYSAGVPPPNYAYPTYRERERQFMEPFYNPRSPRAADPYHNVDHRAYPPTVYPRCPPALTNPYPHPDSPPTHHRSHPASGRRSPAHPPGGGPYRFSSRDSRREKFRENHLQEREESKPSSVIFISNLDPTKNESKIRELFEVYGLIEDLEVKKISPDLASAIIRFASMDCAYRARTGYNSKYIGSTKCRITYGKVNATRRLWLGGLGPSTTLELLDEEFGKFGNILNLDYVSGRPYGYIEYETPNQAQFAVMHLKGTLVAGADKRIRMEYVDSDRKTLKPETNTQASSMSKTSQYRGNEWTSDNNMNDPSNRKRSMSPSDINPKRASISNDGPDNAYYDSTNRASTSSLTKSSNRSSSNSPGPERTVINENNNVDFHDRLGFDEITTHSELNKSESQTRKHPSPKPESITYKVSLARNIDELVEICEQTFQVQLILRNFMFPSILYMCSGIKEVVDKYIAGSNDDPYPLLRITQRWRLHPQPKLEEVKRHMQLGNLGIFIIKSRSEQSPSVSSPCNKTVTGTPGCIQNGDKDVSLNDKIQSETSLMQPRPLKNLISYLEQKDAAGVVSVNYTDKDGQDNQKLLYTFPPGHFAMNIVKTVAPQIDQGDSSKDEYLLGVLVGSIESKF